MNRAYFGAHNHFGACGVLCLVFSAIALAVTPSFERNIGQAQSNAEFLVRLNRAHLLLGSSTMEFRLPEGGVALWEWAGAAPGRWEGLDATGDTTVYYLGSDRARWTQPAPSYRRLIRRNLYPNIDEVAYLRDGAFEYDLVLRPGADPSAVRLKTVGATVGANGEIRAAVRGGEVVQAAPRTYQIADGLRIPADAQFRSDGDGVFRLEVGQYSVGLPLVVDPVVTAVLAVLGGDDDRVVASTNTLTVGVTRSADWNRPPGSGSDLFFRFRTGDSLRTVFWGGDGDDEALGFSAGPGGPVVVGRTTSKNLPIIEAFGIRAQSVYGGGDSDGFMVALTDNDIRFSTYVGGSGHDSLTSVGINPTAAATFYVAVGETDSPGWFDVPITQGGRGALDALIARVSSRGVEAITIGGSANDRATAIAVGSDGTLAIAGDSVSDDFAIPGGSFLQRVGGTDAWLARLQWNDTPQFLSATMWGGSNDERVGAAAYSADGSLYLVGTTSSSDYPLLKAAQATYGGGASDGFIARFDTAGTQVISTYYGGSGREELLAAATRGSDLLAAGFTDSSDLAGTPAGGTDGLFASFDPMGRVVWSTLLGGPTGDRILNIQTLTSGEARVSGWTESREWLVGLGPVEFMNGAAAHPGTTDGFAANLSYSYVTALDQQIGKDLQIALPLTRYTVPGSDGILVARSADPSKLLVSTSPTAIGSDRVVLFFTGDGNSILYLQALDSSGDVEVILSGQFFPERRVAVHLLPSAIFASQKSYSVFATPTNISVPLYVAPVDDRTGTALARQSIRGGLDPRITLISSDESGLHPFNRTPSDLAFDFTVLRAGAYTLTPSSPVFPSGGSITVQSGGSSISSPQFWMAKDGRINFPLDAMLTGHQRLISEDPSKIVMSFPYGTTPTGAVEVTGQSSGVYLDALADSGTVTVRIEGDDGTQNRVVIGLTSGTVTASPSSSIITAGDTAIIRLTLTPVGQPPAGFTVPTQWIRQDANFGIWQFDGQVVQLTNAGFDFSKPAWLFWLQGIRTGSTEVTFFEGDVATHSSTVHLEIKPNRVSFGRPILDIPEGFSLQLKPAAIASQPLQSVQLTIKDPSVALIQTSGTPVSSATVNMVNGYATFLRAKGKTGQTTSITVAATGIDPFDVPIRIVRPVLAPDAQEYWINGQGRVSFSILPLDPDTGQPEAATTYQDHTDPLPITVQATSDICQIPKQLDPYGIYSPQYLLQPTCTASGDEMVQVQAANMASASAIHITSGTTGTKAGAYGEAFPQRAFTGDGLQTEIDVPYGFQSDITLTSGDPSKLLLSLSPNGQGQASVITGSQGKVWLQGYASEGSVTVIATGASVGRTTLTVFLMPATMMVGSIPYVDWGLRQLELTQSTSAVQLSVQVALVDPVTGATFTPPGMSLRWDHDPFLAAVRSSDTSVLEPQLPTPIFSGGSGSQGINLLTKSPGTADLSAVQPAGFVSSTPLRVHVTRATLTTTDHAIVGKDTQTMLSIGATGGLPNGIAVTATSLSPDKLLVSNAVDAPGQSSVTVLSGSAFYVQGLAATGSAQVRLQASGYDDALVTVDFRPVALVGTLGSTPVAPLRATYLSLGFRLDGGSGYGYSVDTGLRAGVTIPVTVRSLDETVVLPSPNGTITFAVLQGQASIQLNALRPGDTVIALDAPLGVSLGTAQFPIHVNNWTFSASQPASLGRTLMVPMTITNGKNQVVTASLTSSGDAPLLFSRDGVTPGQSSLSTTLPSLGSTVVWVEAGRQGTKGTVTVSAPDFDSAQVTVQVVDPLIVINNLPTLLAKGSAVNVTVQLSADFYSYGYTESLGASQDPVTVTIRSSDPSVVRVGSASLQFKPGESTRPLTLQPGNAGTATITLQGPSYFNPPSGTRDYVITVR